MAAAEKEDRNLVEGFSSGVIMHVMLSWDISAVGDRWQQINEQLLACIRPYSWVRPIHNTYVVQILWAEQRTSINGALTNVAKNSLENVNFLLSPLMTGGGYDGWLPQDTWTSINQRVV